MAAEALYLGAVALEATAAAAGVSVVEDAVSTVTGLVEDAAESVVSWVRGTLLCWLGLCDRGPSAKTIAARRQSAAVLNARDLAESAVLGWLCRQGYGPLLELLADPTYMSGTTPGCAYARAHADVRSGVTYVRTFTGDYILGGDAPRIGDRETPAEHFEDYQQQGGAASAGVYAYMTGGAPPGTVNTLLQHTLRSIPGPAARDLWNRYRLIMGDIAKVPLSGEGINRLINVCRKGGGSYDDAQECYRLASYHTGVAVSYISDAPRGEPWRGQEALERVFADELLRAPRQRPDEVIATEEMLISMQAPSSPAVQTMPKKALAGAILVGGAIAIPAGFVLLKLLGRS